MTEDKIKNKKSNIKNTCLPAGRKVKSQKSPPAQHRNATHGGSAEAQGARRKKSKPQVKSKKTKWER